MNRHRPFALAYDAGNLVAPCSVLVRMIESIMIDLLARGTLPTLPTQPLRAYASIIQSIETRVPRQAFEPPDSLLPDPLLPDPLLIEAPGKHQEERILRG